MKASRGMGAISAAKRPQQKKRRDDTSFTQYAEGGEVDSDLEAMRRANAKSKAARLASAMAGVRGEGASASKAYSKPTTPEAKKVERPNFANPKDVQRYREETQAIPELAKGGWIKDAIKKPGALREALDVKEGKTIPSKKLEAAAKKPGKMGQRARLAQTLKGFK